MILPTVQPYFMHFVFEALHKSGLFAEFGFQEIRKWKVLLDEHPSSLKECWDMGDYSHAWGGLLPTSFSLGFWASPRPLLGFVRSTSAPN